MNVFLLIICPESNFFAKFETFKWSINQILKLYKRYEEITFR